MGGMKCTFFLYLISLSGGRGFGHEGAGCGLVDMGITPDISRCITCDVTCDVTSTDRRSDCKVDGKTHGYYPGYFLVCDM